MDTSKKWRRCRFAPPLVVQGKIIVIKSGKIHSLSLFGNPFAGIIAEFPAAVRLCPETFAAAKDLPVTHADTVGAVGTGALNFLSEQHGATSFADGDIIQQLALFFHSFLLRDRKIPARAAESTSLSEGRRKKEPERCRTESVYPSDKLKAADHK